MNGLTGATDAAATPDPPQVELPQGSGAPGGEIVIQDPGVPMGEVSVRSEDTHRQPVGSQPRPTVSVAGPVGGRSSETSPIPAAHVSEPSTGVEVDLEASASSPQLVAPSGQRQEFPGRLRFGRLARVTGAPGPPVKAALPAPPDTVLDGFGTPEGAARVASVRGDGHRYNAEPRQDSAAAMSVPGSDPQYVVLAVADGVGSQELSHHGSAAALLALAEITNQVWLQVVSGTDAGVLTVFEHVDGMIRSEARLKSVEPVALSTTLTFAVVTGERDQSPRKAHVFRVGDSPAFLVRAGTWTELFEAGPSTEISSTGTACLPAMVPAIERVDFRLDAGDILVLSTDGFSGTLRVDGRDDYLAQQWASGPPSLTELLWHVDAMVKSYDDDRSVAAWWEAVSD